jgi:hypothetical protein
MTKLKFGLGNAKLSANIHTFSLPAGWTCPLAHHCFSKANRLTGKIQDGPDTQFRCFAASQETLFPSVRRARWHNFDLLRAAGTVEKMGELIQNSLPVNASLIRVHVAGDFWNESYFLAWVNVAWNNPQITFYGYSKMLPFIVKYKKHLPLNFRFTASKGGKMDSLITKHKLKYAEVVYSTEEAETKGLDIDHDDSLAISFGRSFGLLLHGTQPAKTPAARALAVLKAKGISGYGKMDKHGFRKGQSIKPLTIHVTLKNGEIYLPRVAKKEQYKFVPRQDDRAHYMSI